MAFFACGDNESSTAPENEENYVTNMVTMDCPTTGPQEAHSCAEERLRIGANTLTHAWIGHSNYFACETDCEAEQGTYSVDSDGVSFCIVEVPPIDSTDLNNVHYTDPNWTKYSKAITSLCKDEPIEGLTHSNRIKMHVHQRPLFPCWFRLFTWSKVRRFQRCHLPH